MGAAALRLRGGVAMQGRPFRGVPIGAYIWDGAYLTRNGTIQLAGIGVLTVTRPSATPVVLAGVGTLTASAQFPPNYGKEITLVAGKTPDDLTVGR